MVNIDVEPNNTRGTAEDITSLERELLTGGLVRTNDDWFEIRVNSGSNSLITAALFFDHSGGDLDFQLVDSGGSILSSGTSVTDNEFIQASGLPNGTYFLRVFGFGIPFSQLQTYSLQWDDILLADNRDIDFEPNDTRETAEDISSRERDSLGGGLIISNEDWYEIEVNSGSNSLITAALFFDHSDSDLDFQLVDSGGSILSSGTSVTDNEFIQASDLTNGTYFLRVWSPNGRVLGTQYSIRWDDILLAGNRDIDFEPNNTRETAEDISSREGDLLSGGLVISNEDWFKIEVNSGSNSTITATLFFDHSRGDLDFQLVDSGGNIMIIYR